MKKTQEFFSGRAASDSGRHRPAVALSLWIVPLGTMLLGCYVWVRSMVASVDLETLRVAADGLSRGLLLVLASQRQGSGLPRLCACLR